MNSTQKRGPGRPRKTANVRTIPTPAVRGMSDEEEFLATNTGETITSGSTRGLSEDDPTLGGSWEHTRPGVVLMWKMGGDGHYTPRTVSETSKEFNLRNGWKAKCPDCGTNHESSQLPVSDPNSCPKRTPLALRLCPVCGKRILDNMVSQTQDLEEMIDTSPDSAHIIRDDLMENTTPESRTLLSLQIHMWQRHERQAQMRNLPPIPQGWLNPPVPERPV